MLSQKTLLTLIALFYFTSYSFTQDTWTQKTNFTGKLEREAGVAFVIEGKVYAGTGFSTDFTTLADFKVYDPQTDIWSDIAPFPGPPRLYSTSFVIDNKGYVATGSIGNGSERIDDLWEYDPAQDTWTQKATLPGPARSGAAAFSINGKGYLGCGSAESGLLNDFWEYDPLLNSWAEKDTLPGAGRMKSFYFATGGKGYIGMGGSAFGPFEKDLFSYDPTTESWTQLADYQFEPKGLVAAFVINDIAYMVTGMVSADYFTDLVMAYTPATDSWEQMEYFEGMPRHHSSGFTIGNKGYILFGHLLFGFSNEFWEYTPPEITSATDKLELSNNKIFPNPNTGRFFITYKEKPQTVLLYDLLGRMVSDMEVLYLEDRRMEVNAVVNPGIYFIQLVYSSHQPGSKKVSMFQVSRTIEK